MKRDGRTVRLLYASQSSFGGIKIGNADSVLVDLDEMSHILFAKVSTLVNMAEK